MRLIPTAVLCATLALPGIAHAQTQKVQGSSLAGLCAAAVEFVAGVRSSSGIAQSKELQILQRTRDLYLAIPTFPPGEVEGYANAWSQRMTENLADAPDEATSGKIALQIGTIALDCQKQMVQKVRAANQRNGGTVQPAPAQPSTTEPYTTQPLTTEPDTAVPLETQPYTIQ